jgi:hypothetical protein
MTKPESSRIRLLDRIDWQAHMIRLSQSIPRGNCSELCHETELPGRCDDKCKVRRPRAAILPADSRFH